jgi:hypothetical protein
MDAGRLQRVAQDPRSSSTNTCSGAANAAAAAVSGTFAEVSIPKDALANSILMFARHEATQRSMPRANSRNVNDASELEFPGRAASRGSPGPADDAQMLRSAALDPNYRAPDDRGKVLTGAVDMNIGRRSIHLCGSRPVAALRRLRGPPVSQQSIGLHDRPSANA